MNPSPRRQPDTQALAERPTLRLLSLSLGGPSRPVARLLTRLACEDGPAWFRDALARTPIGEADREQFFCRGGATEAELHQLKDRAKRLSGGDEQQTLIGTLAYLLAVATALEHRGRLISSRPRSELAGVFLDLAQLLDAPWDDLLARAAIRLEPEAA